MSEGHNAGAVYRELAPAVLGYLRSQRVRDPEDVLGEVFLQVARDLQRGRFKGDEAALRVFEMMGEALGKGLANIQNLLDLNAIIFSGGISASFDVIEPHVRRALREYAFAPPLAAVPMLVSALGERAGVIGAAHLTTL